MNYFLFKISLYINIIKLEKLQLMACALRARNLRAKKKPLREGAFLSSVCNQLQGFAIAGNAAGVSEARQEKQRGRKDNTTELVK